MAMMLPADAAKLLNDLGMNWPEGNEDKVMDYGNRWREAGSDLGSMASNSARATSKILADNSGSAMDAFRKSYSEGEFAIQEVTESMSKATNLMGGVMTLIGAAIIGLKVAFIANLIATVVQIAIYIAQAFITFGASLALIPVARILCKKLLDVAIGLATSKIVEG